MKSSSGPQHQKDEGAVDYVLRVLDGLLRYLAPIQMHGADVAHAAQLYFKRTDG